MEKKRLYTKAEFSKAMTKPKQDYGQYLSLLYMAMKRLEMAKDGWERPIIRLRPNKTTDKA